MPNPSLLIVPARFKTGRLYSQIPSNTDNRGDFNVTRATAATRVNSAGLIESVASGIPRLDYFASGGTVGCPALLVEPSGSNLALRSENFLTTWVLLSGTISTGTTAAFTAPDGTTNAGLFTESTDVSATNHQLSQSISTAVVSGTSYTLSCFFKATAANRSARLSLSSALFSGSPEAFFDVTSGVVGTTTDCTARIENYGSGWYRCIMTAICDVAGTASVFVSSASGNTRNYIGNGSAALSIWGAQLETGSVATSYIPTTTAAVTRNADVISVTGAVSGSIGQASGTIYAEVDIRNMAKETHLIRIDDGATANVITLRTLTSNLIRTAITAPTTSGTINISSAAFTAGIVKIAFAYKSGEIALSVNGATALTANGTFVFSASLNRITLGSNVSGGELNDRIRAVALYTERLTDTELAALTAP